MSGPNVIANFVAAPLPNICNYYRGSQTFTNGPLSEGFLINTYSPLTNSPNPDLYINIDQDYLSDTVPPHLNQTWTFTARTKVG